MASWRLLERTEDGQYRAGLRLRMIGTVDSCPTSVAARGPCVLGACRAANRSRARLGVLGELEVAYLDKQPGPRPATSFVPAATLPVHATALGRVLLAFSPARTVGKSVEIVIELPPAILHRNEHRSAVPAVIWLEPGTRNLGLIKNALIRRPWLPCVDDSRGNDPLISTVSRFSGATDRRRRRRDVQQAGDTNAAGWPSSRTPAGGCLLSAVAAGARQYL